MDDVNSHREHGHEKATTQVPSGHVGSDAHPSQKFWETMFHAKLLRQASRTDATSVAILAQVRIQAPGLSFRFCHLARLRFLLWPLLLVALGETGVATHLPPCLAAVETYLPPCLGNQAWSLGVIHRAINRKRMVKMQSCRTAQKAIRHEHARGTQDAHLR